MFSCCSLVQIIVSAVRARGQKLMPSVRTGAVETSISWRNFIGIKYLCEGLWIKFITPGIRIFNNFRPVQLFVLRGVSLKFWKCWWFAMSCLAERNAELAESANIFYRSGVIFWLWKFRLSEAARILLV